MADANGRGLLFIGGGRESVPAIRHAAGLGYQVYVTDGDPQAPGLQWAQEYGAGWAVASTYDASATMQAASEWPLDGVITVGCDVGPVVSAVAVHRRLPAVPVHTVRFGWDKVALNEKLRKGGVRVPVQITPPIVTKPSYRGRGAREVRRYGDMIAERWIEGPQFSTESIIWRGGVLWTAIADRNYDELLTYAPAVIEDGGLTPSRYEDTPIATGIRQTLARVVDVLRLESGTIKSDIVLDAADGMVPMVIEVAIGRLSGGRFCSDAIPLAYQVDFLGACFALACGDDPRPYLVPQGPRRYVCQRYRFPDGPITKHSDRGEMHFAVGDTIDEAVRRAEAWQDQQS